MIESLDWNEILNGVLKGLGVALGTLLVTFASILFAKLKSKINEVKLTNFIQQAVQAAEQLYPNLGTKTGPEKYQYVLDQVLAKFPNMTNNQYLKTLIEGAVYTVSEQVKQISQQQQQTAGLGITII